MPHSTSPTKELNPLPGHPTVETWIAYREDTLDPEENNHLRDHLVTCRSCLELVLDLAEFQGQGSESSTVDELARAAAWRRLAPRLQPVWDWRRLAVAAAVFFTLGTVGLAVHQQHRELANARAALASLERPQANAPIFDLQADGTLRGISEPLARLEVPEDTAFTLILNLGDPLAHPAYDAHLSDVEGETVTRIQDLVPDRHQTLTLTVPGGVLPEGDYLLEIHPAGGDDEASDRFGIRLVHTAGGATP